MGRSGTAVSTRSVPVGSSEPMEVNRRFAVGLGSTAFIVRRDVLVFAVITQSSRGPIVWRSIGVTVASSM